MADQPDLRSIPPWPPESVARYEADAETIAVSRSELDRLNAALARESRRVHELLRENADLKAELERARNG
jgi:chromosome segregation ATPase